MYMSCNAAGQHRLDILRKEVDLAESKRQEAQKAWVAAPEGWLWDVLQQEVDYIREELKELRSRRNKLQDQLDTETGVHSQLLACCIPH